MLKILSLSLMLFVALSSQNKSCSTSDQATADIGKTGVPRFYAELLKLPLSYVGPGSCPSKIHANLKLQTYDKCFLIFFLVAMGCHRSTFPFRRSAVWKGYAHPVLNIC